MKKSSSNFWSLLLFLITNIFGQTDWSLVSDFNIPAGNERVIISESTETSSSRFIYWGGVVTGSSGKKYNRLADLSGSVMYPEPLANEHYSTNRTTEGNVYLKRNDMLGLYQIYDMNSRDLLYEKIITAPYDELVKYYSGGIILVRDGHTPNHFFYDNPNESKTDVGITVGAAYPDYAWTDYAFGLINPLDNAILLISTTDNYNKVLISYVNAMGVIVWERFKDSSTYVLLSQDHHKLALISGNFGEPGQIEIVNTSGATLSTFPGVFSGKGSSFSQTGQYLALSEYSKRINVYRTDTGEVVKSFIPGENNIVRPACSTALDDQAKQLFVIRQDDPNAGNRILEVYSLDESGFDPVWSYPLGLYNVISSKLDGFTLLSFSDDMKQLTAINGRHQFVFDRQQ